MAIAGPAVVGGQGGGVGWGIFVLHETGMIGKMPS